MSEELNILNQFIPNDESGNKKFLEEKTASQTSPDFLTKGGSDFPFAEGPLGKQPLPAPKDKAQIYLYIQGLSLMLMSLVLELEELIQVFSLNQQMKKLS